MEYIVDMQGFKQSRDDYVLKELAILPLKKDSEPLVFLFQEPYKWRRLTDRYKSANAWLERHYHGLSWKSGEIPYVNIGKILRKCLHVASKVFVRGRIRKEWLKRFKFNVIYELGYSLTEQSKKIVTICINHNGCYKTTCALHNVKLMRKYYFENICNKHQ